MARIIYFDENNPNLKYVHEKIGNILDYDIEDELMKQPILDANIEGFEDYFYEENDKYL